MTTGLQKPVRVLPRKRAVVTVLFTDPDGRLLVVKPTYKPRWELPGGAVEDGESPGTAASREVAEELGINRVPSVLLAVRLAAVSGRAVLPTLVTTVAGAVRRFAVEHGEIVTKMLGSNSMVEPDGRKVAFTRRVTLADLDDLGGIGVTAHLMQQWAPKAHDARVIVIGSRLFGFAIHTDSTAGTLDFRYDYGALRYEPVEVPADVAFGVTTLMSKLGLCYAAMDFVVSPDDQWIFIGDVNPGGQYGWLESATGVPLTETLADVLAEGAHP